MTENFPNLETDIQVQEAHRVPSNILLIDDIDATMKSAP